MARMPDRPEFTEADLRRLAGPKSFERGQDYLHEVTDLDVTGTVDYRSLRQAAEDTGTWVTEREQTLSLLATDAASKRGQNCPPGPLAQS